MSSVIRYAVKREYTDLPLKLITQAEVFTSGSGQRKKVKALWDTGAMLSAISEEIKEKLGLKHHDRKIINSVNEVKEVDVVKVSIRIPDLKEVNDFPMLVLKLIKDADILIGMDIIQRGDFSISNGGGKTLFTFVQPPFEDKIDLYKKAVAANNHNKI